MPTQTTTRATESELDPSAIYAVLADIGTLPAWAPAFADAVERIDDTHCQVRKNGETFRLELIAHRSAGTVDFIREMSSNRRGGAYVRVTPRPLGGSTLTITVPLAPNATEADVARIVDQELQNIIGLARP